MEAVITIALVMGVVQLIKRAFKRDFQDVAIILGAAAVGAVCGLTGFEGLTLGTGIATGLAASGIVTLGQSIGKTDGED